MLGFKVQGSFRRLQTLKKDHGNALNSFVLTTPIVSLTTTWTTLCYSYNYTTLFFLSSLCFSSLQNCPPNYVSSWCCFSFLGIYHFSRLSWLMDSLQKFIDFILNKTSTCKRRVGSRKRLSKFRLFWSKELWHEGVQCQSSHFILLYHWKLFLLWKIWSMEGFCSWGQIM